MTDIQSAAKWDDAMYKKVVSFLSGQTKTALENGGSNDELFKVIDNIKSSPDFTDEDKVWLYFSFGVWLGKKTLSL